MKLTRSEFEQRYAENTLKIALVGMSNIGKSYTGMRLSTRFDFKLIEVDALIREQLGQGSMEDFADWQGQPYSEGYGEREKRSIALETEATRQALGYNLGNAVLDTTGSVIYTDKDVQKLLTNHWFVVYISASTDAIERLKVQYFKQPKPLIWNGHYQRESGQSQDEAILESYPKLLASRSKSYDNLADTTIGSDVILDTTLTIEDIFQRLKPAA
jgi:shikimate kinase